MGVEKRKAPVWTVPVRGAVLSLCAYLTGVSLLALGIASGRVEEGSAGAVLAVLAFAASLAGGISAAGRCGSLPGGLFSAAIFGLVLLCAGLAVWKETAWQGGRTALLLCILGGGLLSELRWKGKKRTRRRIR